MFRWLWWPITLEDFKRSRGVDNFRWIGSHNDLHLLARSDAKVNYLVPSAMKNPSDYVSTTLKIIEKEKVDLFIPKSDAELAAISPYLNELGCKTFLPNYLEIKSHRINLNFLFY